MVSRTYPRTARWESVTRLSGAALFTSYFLPDWYGTTLDTNKHAGDTGREYHDQ